MPNALDVVGRLMVEMGGDASARVEARGDTIVVELPSFRAAFAILKRWPGARGRRETIRGIHQALMGAGLALRVQVGPATVGLLGVGAKARLASRLLGLDPLEIKVDGLLAARRRGHRPER